MYVEPRPKGRHFRPDDRIAIQALYKAGHSQREIAKEIGCSQSSISRELKKGKSTAIRRCDLYFLLYL